MPEEISFADERFMSAQEKDKVLQAWKRFLKSGCAKAQFTELLYHHLSQHCSFIAHYDRHGFYEVYFGRVTAQLFRFFDQFDPQLPGITAEYGTTHWLSEFNTGADLNQAMRTAAGPYLEALRQRFREEQRQHEITAANSILARYGLRAVPGAAATNDTPVTQAAIRETHSVAPIQPRLFGE